MGINNWAVIPIKCYHSFGLAEAKHLAWCTLHGLSSTARDLNQHEDSPHLNYTNLAYANFRTIVRSWLKRLVLINYSRRSTNPIWIYDKQCSWVPWIVFYHIPENAERHVTAFRTCSIDVPNAFRTWTQC